MQVGEGVCARVTVERVSGSRVTFATACLSGAGEVLVDGQAVALIPAASAAAVDIGGAAVGG